MKYLKHLLLSLVAVITLASAVPVASAQVVVIGPRHHRPYRRYPRRYPHRYYRHHRPGYYR